VFPGAAGRMYLRSLRTRSLGCSRRRHAESGWWACYWAYRRERW
jgi:hypothetical protein